MSLVESPVKQCKLLQHQKHNPQQKHNAGDEVRFCTKDFPFLNEDDIVEIYNQEEEYPRLLLKIGKGSLREEFHRDAMSVEQSITVNFQLKAYSDVIVKKVCREDVELDSIELTFKDQYLGRSEMWRLKNSLMDTCLYLGKKIEFVSSIRCQVHEMWSHGDKVASGVVSPATKIVFRSSTSMVYLFIQMSSEMWEFDIYGDLYFEKAVNGFLAELFAKWKKNGCNHEVTIVLFSRLYYEATSLDQFPESVRECLQSDYRGRFYEDYYRLAVQNGKYDDWGHILIFLKHIFVDYQKHVLNAHKKSNPGVKIPKAFISSASRGNFLEVLNMSLNVFEKHYKDRSFDRTGQLSVVITPGVGVFEVDRELTNVTMQRIIDNGVGSDLVCVGEQPLHAVPLLLKFNNKGLSQNNVEDYSLPHWINLSFYSTNKKVGYSSFIPRIKLPMFRQTSKSSVSWDWNIKPQYRISKLKQDGTENAWPNSIYDFDDYDQRIFQYQNVQSISQHRRSVQKKRSHHPEYYRYIKRQNSEPEINPGNLEITLPNSSSNIDTSTQSQLIESAPSTTPTAAITIPSKKMASLSHLYSSSFGALNIEIKSKVAANNKENWPYDDLWSQKLLSPGSNSLQSGISPKDKPISYAKPVIEPRVSSKALINPFDPSHAVIKLTSSRRRWTHIFPRGPTGVLIQQHHFQSAGPSTLEIVHEGLDSPDSLSANKSLIDTPSRSGSGRNSVTKQSSTEGKLTLMWSPTGEQEWTPALQTGVDWKSLTIPACLPLTTDYFPDERSFEADYLFSDYSLLPDDVNADYAQQRVIYRTPLTTKEVFSELVSQRLAQGFQLVIRPISEDVEKPSTNPPLIRSTTIESQSAEVEEYILSIGRVFHKIQLEGSTITVTRYRPKHAYPSLKVHYRYRLNPPNSSDYEVSAAEFTTEKLENYSWNYLDHYICTRGDKGFALNEGLKYWRFRMYLLPNSQQGTKRILDETVDYTNIYSRISEEENSSMVENFLKFLEAIVNRLRRARCSKKLRITGPLTTTAATTFKERTGSNKMGDKLKSKPGSKDTSGEFGKFDERLSPVDNIEFTFPESLPNSVPDSFQHGSDDNDEPMIMLSPTTSHRGILEAMARSNSGFSFVKSADLPHWTFVSADAVNWLMEHTEGGMDESVAKAKFEEMVMDQLIVHASGHLDHKFIYGFYLYSILWFHKDGNIKQSNLEMFQNDWLEVEVTNNSQKTNPPPVQIVSPQTTNSESELFPTIEEKDTSVKVSDYEKVQLYKSVFLEVDLGKKSDREEWSHLKYQATYKPDEGFELVVQWVQATGCIITELIQGWSRKAQQCNMVLIPIPNDPFAISCSAKSDSLRGPIFIPLNAEIILNIRTFLSEGYPQEKWSQIMFELQEEIVVQFGFIPSLNPNEYDPHHHYVHLTGNMFVFIPTPSSATDKSRKNRFRRPQYDSTSSTTGSQDESFISRNVNRKNKEGFIEEKRVGFLWSWNYMLSKRWKNSSTPVLGDETFMMKMLRDFQKFCGGNDERLQNFWENYKDKMVENNRKETTDLCDVSTNDNLQVL